MVREGFLEEATASRALQGKEQKGAGSILVAWQMVPEPVTAARRHTLICFSVPLSQNASSFKLRKLK